MSTWVIAGAGAFAVLWSFGSELTVAGHRTFALPWKVIAHFPIARAVAPNRVIVYAWLALAVLLAIWLATPGRRPAARWALVLIGLVLILPDGGSPLFRGRPNQPRLFTTSAYKRIFTRGSTVLLLPYDGYGYSMLWQAQADFWFRMPEGNVSGVPPA
ncbi:MAG: hypothetical protein ACLP8S_29525 [Solirubrobacteraceae bacterium]